MNAIDMLRQDHRRVENLFKQYEAAQGSDERKRQIGEEACAELEIHADLEQEDFYPAVQVVGLEGADLIVDAEREHDAVKGLISKLRRLHADAKEYDAVFAQLQQLVEQHVGFEEEKIFPYAEEILKADDLDHIAHRMSERKAAG